MSSFKQLNKADITTVPYAANKHWDFFYTGSPSNGITFYRGTKSTFSTAGSTTNGQYNSLTYDLINHMFYQSYSGSLLDTGSLMFNSNTYESASQQRPTSSYFIYNNNPQLIKNFPSSSGEQISVISISPKIFGSKILPHSFQISASSVFIVDDGYGNLFDVDQARDDYVLLDYISSSYIYDPTPNQGIIFVGNIFYAQGLVVITNQSPDYIDLLNPSPSPFTQVQLSFQNEHIIYENEVRCIVRESDFNLSYNPTLLKYGTTLTTASVDINNVIVSSSIEYVTIQTFPFVLEEGYITTTFTLNTSLPQDIVIQYVVDYSVPPGFPSSYQILGSVTIPAGNLSKSSTYLVPFSFGFPSPDQIVINSVTITSTAYKQYELIDSTIKDFATGSFFQPYTTTIGLYNDNNDLLMVAKLGKPIVLSSDTDMTFIVRYDT